MTENEYADGVTCSTVGIGENPVWRLSTRFYSRNFQCVRATLMIIGCQARPNNAITRLASAVGVRSKPLKASYLLPMSPCNIKGVLFTPYALFNDRIGDYRYCLGSYVARIETKLASTSSL